LGLWDAKPFMVIVRGESVDLPAKERERLKNLTDPTWPHVYARLDCSFDEFISVFPANHVQGVPGDRVRCLVNLCEIAGIQPIVLGPRGKERIAPVWEIV
jgi:L-fucose isomerase